MSDDLHYDVRTLAYRKRRGEITDDEIDAFRAGLPDDAEHGEPTVTRFAASYARRNEDSNSNE